MKTPLIKKSEKVYAITYEDDYERRGEPAEIVGLKKVSGVLLSARQWKMDYSNIARYTKGGYAIKLLINY